MAATSPFSSGFRPGTHKNKFLAVTNCTLGDLHIDQRIGLGKKTALGDAG
jgi:hypothetical protein